jgi:hypothetical protein
MIRFEILFPYAHAKATEFDEKNGNAKWKDLERRKWNNEVNKRHRLKNSQRGSKIR